VVPFLWDVNQLRLKRSQFLWQLVNQVSFFKFVVGGITYHDKTTLSPTCPTDFQKQYVVHHGGTEGNRPQITLRSPTEDC
jgi:hypothetical protein